MDIDNVLLFATGNTDKRREFESILGDFLNPMWEIFDLTTWPDPVPEVVEDQEDFRGNALKKAEQVSLATGTTTIADDSGLVVDALDGDPGVQSARYAGPGATDEENNRKLIDALQGIPERRRTARYVCVIAMVVSAKEVGRAILERARKRFRAIPEARPTEEGKLSKAGSRVYIWFRGTVEGRIIDEARGEGGFGYDPHFYVPEWDKTMAEVALEKKNEISHRAEALGKLREMFPKRVHP